MTAVPETADKGKPGADAAGPASSESLVFFWRVLDRGSNHLVDSTAAGIENRVTEVRSKVENRLRENGIMGRGLVTSAGGDEWRCDYAPDYQDSGSLVWTPPLPA